MMKKKFYKDLFEKLDLNKEVFIVTVIQGSYDGKNIVGQKLFKSKKFMAIENDNLKNFWDEILSKIDFDKGTYVLELDNDIKLFIEYIIGKPNLIVCGGGHVALPLCEMANLLEFNVTVIDNREEFANKERFPMVSNVICKDFNQAFEEVEFNKNSYFAIVTRGHKYDRECLEIILKNDFYYVGMIGSKGKVQFVISSLLEKGYKKEDIDKVHTPIGLSIGAKTPAEVAVSILSEIIQVKNEKIISTIPDDISNTISNANEPMILTTIIEKHGSGPRDPGTKMLIKKNGEFIGTVGGGSVEYSVYKRALKLFEEKESILEEYNLSNSASAKLGMACGGHIKVFFEFINCDCNKTK
ncbi:xanthine dehydrogenase [Clostridium botulinum]|nr:xanthine dehydrogenase [Clostridium botulinum]NFG22518.1 xanthine dehydrogenase [Clostridium botulinum]NFH88967.1 xanthine dehydrogenase [Clostridium botulinum]NFI16563.1 xanthine dehydrogenase [Clostridium botulinum]NFI52733.1 xanthine dehydrogenase [Clostridium botulinum]